VVAMQRYHVVKGREGKRAALKKKLTKTLLLRLLIQVSRHPPHRHTQLRATFLLLPAAPPPSNAAAPAGPGDGFENPPVDLDLPTPPRRTHQGKWNNYPEDHLRVDVQHPPPSQATATVVV